MLRNRILNHWQTYRPTLLRDLERSGELEAVIASLELTIRERQGRLLAQGMSLEQADEVLRPMWMVFGDVPCAVETQRQLGSRLRNHL